MAENRIAAPLVREVKYDAKSLDQLVPTLNEKQAELLFQYPMVYVIHSEEKLLTVYVGETNDIKRRTLQHLGQDPSQREDWEELKNEKDAQMIVIGHEHFNKSMTLDIENRLMLYLSGSEAITKLNNRRTNPQGKYYPAQESDQIFSKIWRKLHSLNQVVFPLESVIRDSALFKASPFHELTDEQQQARQLILDRVATALQNKQVGQLILVEGVAGSGKTVLLSSLFYEMVRTLDNQGRFKSHPTNVGNSGNSGSSHEKQVAEPNISAAMLVNNDEQLKVYTQIMYKLEVASAKADNVTKPTHFILTHNSNEPVDVVLVDEAHLLWTQGKQTYRGKNQLFDLLKRARVVIAVFDRNQVIATNGYWEEQQLAELEGEAKQKQNLITLKHQLRVQGGPAIENWLRSLVQGRQLLPIPQHDEKGYEIKVFCSPQALYTAIKHQAADEEHGLSRMLATFDWPFIQGKKDSNGDYWQVRVGSWSLPWNKQIKATSAGTRGKKSQLSWAEMPETINEVGSTFTIQGFDLNYAGVIIGPSVKLRHGRIIFDAKASCNKRARNKRTLANNKKIDVSDELLQNELNVLLTRGVHGLYLYAVDPELQAALLAAQEGRQVAGDQMVAEKGATKSRGL